MGRRSSFLGARVGMPPGSALSARHVRWPGPWGWGFRSGPRLPSPSSPSPAVSSADALGLTWLGGSGSHASHLPGSQPSPSCGFPGSTSPPPPALQGWGTWLPRVRSRAALSAVPMPVPSKPASPLLTRRLLSAGLAPQTLPAPPSTPASSPRPAGQRHLQMSVRESLSGPGRTQSTGGQDHAHSMHFPRTPAPHGLTPAHHRPSAADTPGLALVAERGHPACGLTSAWEVRVGGLDSISSFASGPWPDAEDGCWSPSAPWFLGYGLGCPATRRSWKAWP